MIIIFMMLIIVMVMRFGNRCVSAKEWVVWEITGELADYITFTD